MREAEFVRQFRSVLAAPVAGLSENEKLEIARQLVADIHARGSEEHMADALWVPFVTGRRPIDEATHRGLGSSDHVGLILDGEDPNRMYLLFRLENFETLSLAELEGCEVRVTLSFAGPWGRESHAPIPGWHNRKIDLRSFVCEPAGKPSLASATIMDHVKGTFVIELDPRGEFLPDRWQWNDAPESLRAAATDAEDPFTFGHLYIQQVRAELMVLRNGVPFSVQETLFDVCDARRFGSLYKRVVEKIIRPDVSAQAKRAGTSADHSYHPWYPVLLIGSDKADLYTRALIEDIVHKKRHLTDPRWLLRVGLYLELLTCIGIFEAVKDDLGDLLTPAERRAYETSPDYEAIRAAVDVNAWKRVWQLRTIVFPQVGAPKSGDVSALNLLAKKKATLAFLEAHHEDLKRAIEFAGPNEHNAQETWHRVFRDAERAVLRKTALAFPELDSLGAKAKEFVLWHRKGRLGGLSLPQAVSGWFGDQDGLYASACNQYRASMNHVSKWAKSKGLMDYTGAECIPESVSLLQAFMGERHVRMAQLQKRDGYAGTLEIALDIVPPAGVSRENVLLLLRGVSIFGVLNDVELTDLAEAIRPIELGPVERIIVEGRPGSSLFVLADGKLEVLIRQTDGQDLPVATLESGAVFGEMSLLTGAARSATVRSVDSAVVYEIGQQQIAPILRNRPEIIEELAFIMGPRVTASAAAKQQYGSRGVTVSLASRIRSFLLTEIG